METIAVSDLRANLMKILKEIEHGAIINVSSRGRIVAKLIPPEYSKEIAKNKNKYRSKSRAKKYNNVILKFNEKIEDYERRKKAFNVEVEEYNRRVEKSYLNELGKRK